MKLKNITWRNFKSYSNIPTTIDFDDENSLNLVVGDNGTGKTSIAEVITYSLYGKIDNFTNSDIPNRVNKNFYSRIEVECDGHNIIIERGLSPTIFAVKIDGENVDTAGKTNVQSMLEDVYFKIPYSVFSNTLVLSVSGYKSLINLGASDKRNIIDKIFGFTFYNDVNKLLKDEVKQMTTNLDITTGSIRTSNGYIENYTKQISEIDKNSITQEELDELSQTISEIEKVNKENEKLIEKIDSIKNDLNNQTYDQSAIYKEYQIKINSIDERISLIDSGKCPTCGSDLTSEYFQKERESLSNERKEYIKMQEDIKQKLLDIKSKINALDKKKQQTSKKIRHSEVVELKSDLKSKQALKNKNSSQFIKLRDEMKEQLSTLNEEYAGYKKEIGILNVLQEVFGDNGIKKYITSQYTPRINAMIAEVISHMGLNYVVEFDDAFNGKITLNGYSVKYSTLSAGEKKRIDFACVISIIKFLKLQLGEMNLLFLDELFSNIDITGVGDMIEMLRKYCEEMNLNIYLIHHAHLEGICFDKVLRTYKPDGFSRLEII